MLVCLFSSILQEFEFISTSYVLNGDSKTVNTISWDMSNGESFSLDMSNVRLSNGFNNRGSDESILVPVRVL